MIGVIGVSYKHSSLSLREELARIFTKLPLENRIFLHTCHRAELYFSDPDPVLAHEEILSLIRHHGGDALVYPLFTFFGEECVYHLEKVTSGFDSLFLGETEIQGQVKAAYETARKRHLLPKELHILFQKALHAGKILRTSFEKHFPSPLSHEVVQLILQKNIQEALLVGSSSINKAIASLLIKSGLTVSFTNRTKEKASSLAKEYGGHVLPWNELEAYWCSFPCCVFATRSPSYLISAQKTSPLHSPLLIDLGVPRNVDPSIVFQGATLYNIDSFSPKAQDLSIPYETALQERARHDFFVSQDNLKFSPIPVNKDTSVLHLGLPCPDKLL